MAPEDLITDEIVAAAVREDFGNGFQVVSWNHEPCSETGEKFFNSFKRVFVTYEGEGFRDSTSYVAKLNPCEVEDLYDSYRKRGMQKEAFFYKTLLPLLNSELKMKGEATLRVPKYLYSSVEPGREVIILEDLQRRGFEAPRIIEMDEAHSALIAKELGRLHSASRNLQKSMKGKDLESVFPLLVESWLLGDQRLKEAYGHFFAKGVKLNSCLASVLEEFKNSTVVDRLKGKEINALTGELIYNHKWGVICHGDIHRTNFLFRYDKNEIPIEIMVLDWQTVRLATLASDLSSLIFCFFSESLREQNFSPILDHYYNSLISSLQFTLEELENEVKNNAFGLLMYFYFVPSTLSAKACPELFKDSEEKEITKEEAKTLLNSSPKLKNIFCGYLKALNSKPLYYFRH